MRHTVADEPCFLVRTASYNFSHGQALAPHSHPWGQLIYAARGVLSVWTDEGSWVVPPQWAIWAPRGVTHAMRFSGAAALRTLYLRPGLGAQPARSTVVAVSPLLRELVLRAVSMGMLDERQRTSVALADSILDELVALSVPSLELPQPRSALLRRVADSVASEPCARENHVGLARAFGVSVRTLERGFLRETGMSLGRWRRHARLVDALRRLGAGASVKEVAAEAGYCSPSAFVAAFKATFDTTPGSYFSVPLATVPDRRHHALD